MDRINVGRLSFRRKNSHKKDKNKNEHADKNKEEHKLPLKYIR